MSRSSLGQLFRIEWGDYPFTFGRLAYLLQKKIQGGLRAAWYRDVIRPRILDTPPIRTLDRTCEIHALTSAGDWLNMLWALKSFYRFSPRKYAVCIHDDGTVGEGAREALCSAFPDARFISRKDADRRLSHVLEPLPRCKDLRATNTFALKLFDYHVFAELPRVMVLDSDILFFSEPKAFLSTLETSENNSLNRDWRDGYSVEPETVRSHTGLELPPRINAGFGLIHSESIRLDWVEEFLALPGILSHSHRIEQTLVALCSARYGFSMLPEEYDIHTGPKRAGSPCRHYTGPIRDLMYREGMRELLRAGFLEAPTPA